MKSRKILLILLCAVAIIAVWQLSTKRDLLKSDMISQAWEEATGKQPSPDEPASAKSDIFSQTVALGPPKAEPAPVIPTASAGEMFPFAADTPALTSTVALPDHEAPIVYVAFCGDSSDAYTSASLCFGEFYKYQIRQRGRAGLLMNPLPNGRLLKYKSRSFTDNATQVPFETYLVDAQVHGADILLYPTFDGTTSAPVVNVRMIDMNTSRSETWSSEQLALTSVKDIITSSAESALKFAGHSDEEISQTKIAQGAPSDETFAWYATASKDDMNYENLLKIIEADPEFIYVYSQEAGTTWTGQLVDMGLRKFPDDFRLITQKATALYEAGSTVSLIRYMSEVIRRYPDDLFSYYMLPDRLNKIYSPGPPSRETPQEYKTLLTQLGLMSKRHPESYYLAWDYAYGLKSLGGYIRGGHTVDRIPGHIWPERAKYVSEAYDIMVGLCNKHPDFASLLTALSYFAEDVREVNPHEQRRFIERVAALDPRETDVEIRAASSHSIGYGRQKDFFAFMDLAFKNHAGDPQATAELARAMKQELYRQIQWKEMDLQEANTNGNPYINRFLDAAAFVYSTGQNLGLDSDQAYYTAMELQGKRDKIDEWRQSGQNSYVAAMVADEYYKASDWESCIKYAKLALPHMSNDDKEHYIRYYLVKSLWKLKRYEESLKEARAGIFRYPGKQTFPYMYAVVASEAGINLESAFDCAWYAVTLDTSNQGANETFEKLRAKLNKPKHPSLEALGN